MNMVKIIKSNLIIIFITIFLTSCASISNPTFGPIQEENFPSVFAEIIEVDQQEVIFYSRAIWYPNKNGFKFLPAGKKSRKGVIVYTTESVYFSEWAGKNYNVVFSAVYDEVSELRLAANELFGRIVIKKDRYNSFEIMGVNGPDLPDKDETKVAYDIIATQKENQ